MRNTLYKAYLDDFASFEGRPVRNAMYVVTSLLHVHLLIFPLSPICCTAALPQIMRNTLYKAYLDDFASFCEKLGGTTSEVMSDLLAFEADRRALNITLNR
jgi:vacuolar-type H+-ATPase subunit C/Vma6